MAVDRPRQAADPIRWPDVAATPTARVRAFAAGALVQWILRDLPLRVALPNGRVLGAGTMSDPILRLHRPDEFYRRVGAYGLVGFGESYMAGEWDADDLIGVLEVFAHRLSVLIPPALQRLRRTATLRPPSSDRPVRGNSRNNVARHYDLSNDLFATFLDPTMTYSSALFPEPLDAGLVRDHGSLLDAQRRKIDRLLDLTGVQAGSRVLEIGTGWGELALRAAERGADVTSITMSEQQRDLALRRIQAAGVADRVRVELCDYRDAHGSYDAILSVEMIEAVGYEYWPTYFGVLDARLRPGGKVGLQAITMPHDRMLATRDTFTWIQKYIFPGGFLPSVNAIERMVSQHTSLSITDRFAFGSHYAETLRLWRAAFEVDPARIEALGFDEVFRRMWSLYLAYSEAGFRSGYLDVQQIVLEKREEQETR
jgi:cyclopropane-fatty-acyl-phospholipid synthase